MKNYKEFKKDLSDNVKMKAKGIFYKYYEKYKNDKPLVLISKSKDDEKFVKKIESIKKPKGEE